MTSSSHDISQPRPLIAYLYASPLVSRNTHGHLVPIPALDVREESNLLEDTFKAANRQVDLSVSIATEDNLVANLAPQTKVIHYAGHGLLDGLGFEDGRGGLRSLSIPELSEKLSNHNARGLQLVVVDACHSQASGQAFVQAGVPHVVAVRLDAQVTDVASQRFMHIFYLSLAVGDTVQQAFQKGQAAVSVTPNISKESLLRQRHKFLLLPEDKPHDVRLFDTLATGQPRNCTPPLPKNDCDNVPQTFVGRFVLMHHIIQAYHQGKRWITLVGDKLIGKTSVGSAVCFYLNRRRAVPGGVWFIPIHRTVPNVASVRQDADALAVAAANTGSPAPSPRHLGTSEMEHVYHALIFAAIRASVPPDDPLVDVHDFVSLANVLNNQIQGKGIIFFDGANEWCRMCDTNTTDNLSFNHARFALTTFILALLRVTDDTVVLQTSTFAFMGSPNGTNDLDAAVRAASAVVPEPRNPTASNAVNGTLARTFSAGLHTSTPRDRETVVNIPPLSSPDAVRLFVSSAASEIISPELFDPDRAANALEREERVAHVRLVDALLGVPSLIIRVGKMIAEGPIEMPALRGVVAEVVMQYKQSVEQDLAMVDTDQIAPHTHPATRREGSIPTTNSMPFGSSPITAWKPGVTPSTHGVGMGFPSSFHTNMPPTNKPSQWQPSTAPATAADNNNRAGFGQPTGFRQPNVGGFPQHNNASSLALNGARDAFGHPRHSMGQHQFAPPQSSGQHQIASRHSTSLRQHPTSPHQHPTNSPHQHSTSQPPQPPHPGGIAQQPFAHHQQPNQSCDGTSWNTASKASASMRAFGQPTPSPPHLSSWQDIWDKATCPRTRAVTWTSLIPVVQSDFCSFLYSDCQHLDPRVLSYEDLDAMKRQVFGTECVDAATTIAASDLSRFWKWFSATMLTIKLVVDVWSARQTSSFLIHGFLSKARAELLLKGQPVGTFLIRISENRPGMLAFSFVAKPGVVGHSITKPCPDGTGFQIQVAGKGVVTHPTLQSLVLSIDFLRLVWPGFTKEETFGSIG